jgi:ATP-dependent DNA helicase RecG
VEDGNLKRLAIFLLGKNSCRFFINAFDKIGRFGQTDEDLRFHEVIQGNAF